MNPSKITLGDHLGHMLFHMKCSVGLPEMLLKIEMLKNEIPALSKNNIAVCQDFTAQNFSRSFSPEGLHLNMQIEYVIRYEDGELYTLALEASVYFGLLTGQITVFIRGDVVTNEHVRLSLLPARDALRGCNEIACHTMRNPQNDYHVKVKQIIHAAGSVYVDNEEYLEINKHLYGLAAQVSVQSEVFWTQWKKLASETFMFIAPGSRKVRRSLNKAIHDFALEYNVFGGDHIDRIRAIVDPLIALQELPRMCLVCKYFSTVFGGLNSLCAEQYAPIMILPKEILLNIFALAINVEQGAISGRNGMAHYL